MNSEHIVSESGQSQQTSYSFVYNNHQNRQIYRDRKLNRVHFKWMNSSSIKLLCEKDQCRNKFNSYIVFKAISKSTSLKRAGLAKYGKTEQGQNRQLGPANTKLKWRSWQLFASKYTYNLFTVEFTTWREAITEWSWKIDWILWEARRAWLYNLL